MRMIVDKIEDEIATVELEDGNLINVPKIIVGKAREGDVIELIICEKETEYRRTIIEELANDLFEK